MTDYEIGPQKPPPDPRGWLAFDWLPPDLQNAEDSTQSADHERFRLHEQTDGLNYAAWTRSATDAERALLEHLGHTLPNDLTTRVRWVTPGVRNRRWPQLEGAGA